MNLPPDLMQQFFDSNGDPLSGGKVYTYAAGTSTLQNTYTDQSGGTPNANPIVLDSSGRCAMWLDPDLSYKFVIKDSNDATVKTIDNVIGLLTVDAVNTASIQDLAVTTAKIADDAVTSAKLQDDASVDANRAVTANHIRNGVVSAAKLEGTAVGITGVVNAGITASVASNQMTVNLVDSAGATPSASSPVKIPFRSSTLTAGQTVSRSVSAALSIVIPNGATLGLVNNQSQYVYVYAIDNAGTVELAVAGSQFFNEAVLHNTTAISGTSTSMNTLYSTSARTNVAVRFIGKVKSTQVTAGTYASNPTEIALSPLPPQPVRHVVRVHTSASTGSTGNRVRVFSTVVENSGSAITYTSDATNGDTFTINQSGIYAVSTSINSGGSDLVGITKNESGTTQMTSVANSNRLACAGQGAAERPGCAAWIGWLDSGDVLRAHQDGATTGTSTGLSQFTIVKLA